MHIAGHFDPFYKTTGSWHEYSPETNESAKTHDNITSIARKDHFEQDWNVFCFLLGPSNIQSRSTNPKW